MKRFVKKATEILELPREVVSNVSKITLTGFDELIIENFKGIVEYEDFFVRIETYIGSVNINGFNLKLNQMNEEDIMITGNIENISFEQKKMI